MTSVEQLYDCAERLSQAKDFAAFESDYKTILSGVRGDDRAKRLSSQFIVRFFSKFPSLSSAALDAILDLCEDDAVDIRKQAIKDLPNLCREMKEYLPKIADVLSQLLQTDDSSELQVIQTSLMSLLRKDAKGTLIGLFSQIKTGGDLTRERAIKFLHLKMKTEGRDLFTKEAEVTMLLEIKGCLGDCTADEFHLFMTILNMTSIPKTVSGQAQLLEITSTMADLDKPFNATDVEAVDKFVQCAKVATGFFSGQAKSTRYCEYLYHKVLPQLHSIPDLDTQSQILKILGEAVMYTSDISEPAVATKNVFQKLLDYMPLPPADAVEAAESGTDPEFEFTKVECLLLAFHTVGKQAPEHLTENPEVLKDFRARLQYFARGVQGYIKKLKEFLANKTRAELQKEENKIKSVALKCTLNIQSLIKDLFHTPPSYKAKIIISWKEEVQEKKKVVSGAGSKRSSISFDDNAGKKPRGGGSGSSWRGGKSGLYQPPTGKYSTGVGEYRDGGARSYNRRGNSGRGRRGGYSY